MSRFSKPLVLSVFVLAAMVGSASVGAWVFSPRIPESLVGQQASQISTVTEQSIDDARALDLAMTIESSKKLHSSSSGLVTSIPVAPGDDLVSGKPAFSVNSENVMALRSATPLWRTLEKGDKGPDVSGLQEELSRLGHSVAVDGEVGPYTLAAVADLLELTDKEKRTFKAIEPHRFLWIPYSSTKVSAVAFGIGETITVSSQLFTVEDVLVDAKLTQIPADLIPGERVLVLGGEQLGVDEEGHVVAQDLETLKRTREFQMWAQDPDNAAPVSGKYALSEAASVHAVAPAAIYDLDGSQACLTDGQQGYSVSVVTSELGKTLVYFDGNAAVPEQVQISPEEQPACR